MNTRCMPPTPAQVRDAMDWLRSFESDPKTPEFEHATVLLYVYDGIERLNNIIARQSCPGTEGVAP